MFMMMFLFFLAIIVSFIMRAIEIASETGSKAVRKASEFGSYVQNEWRQASETEM
jgi:hypothetical protein